MGLHPLLSVLVRRPDLLADHVAGYADLLREEANTTGTELARRALAWAIAALAFLAFLLLAGVAAMLAAMQGHLHWALLLVPGSALALCIAALLRARRKFTHPIMNEVRAQLDADMQALRTLGAS